MKTKTITSIGVSVGISCHPDGEPTPKLKHYFPPITTLRDFLLEVVFYSASPTEEIKTPKEEYADDSENYTKPRDNYSNYDLWNLNE